MSNQSEMELIELVKSEQRGFRVILFTGLATLLVLVLMSGALGVYYFYVSQQLSQTALELQHDAFNARRQMDQQNNRSADQGRLLRRLTFQIRRVANQPDAQVNPAAAIEAAQAYLQIGKLSDDDERVMTAVTGARAGSPALQALLRGVSILISWDQNGESIAPSDRGLPSRLQRALSAFETAAADPELAHAAAAGRAWVHYIKASSSVSNYAAADCEAVFSAVAASAENDAPGPQPLWWQAQCERKLGRTSEALRDYARALQSSYPAIGGDARRDWAMTAELTLAMNAFHGVGTTLIALHDTPDSDAIKGPALEVARHACPIDTPRAHAPDLQLAEACLRTAVALRERLGQTPNQVSGSAENLGFVYLRDGNFQAAFDHAQQVEHTGLFAWNELVRALSAARVGAAGASAGPVARRNVSFFQVGQFNVCEIEALLGPELARQATTLISKTHPDESVACS